MDDNPAFVFLDIDYVNEAYIIRRNTKVIAINSAIEVDLTGQMPSHHAPLKASRASCRFSSPGAGVVTTRAHLHYVVTEYGVAFLFGKNLRQRAQALMEIAHPNDREMLEKACVERFREF